MPPIGRSSPAKIARWKLLGTRLEERLEELPHLKESHARLQQLIAEAEATQARFEVHRAAWRQAASRNEEIAREGEDLRSRLAGALHHHLGPKSLELVEFGLKPRRAGRPKGAPAPPAPSPPGGEAARQPAAGDPPPQT